MKFKISRNYVFLALLAISAVAYTSDGASWITNFLTYLLVTVILCALGLLLFMVWKNTSLLRENGELLLTIKELRKKMKLNHDKPKNIRYVPTVEEVSAYAVAYLGKDGKLLSANKSFKRFFGKKILVGDNWDDFFTKNFTSSVPKLKNKMVLYRYGDDPRNVYAISSKLLINSKIEFRVCEIISFDAKDLTKVSEHYAKGLSDNFVDLGDVFEQAFSEAGQLQMGQSLSFPVFRNNNERFLHIGFDKSYELARYLGRLSQGVSLLMSNDNKNSVKGELDIYFNRAENCIFDLSFENINLKNEMSTYFNMSGSKHTLSSVLSELEVVLNQVGFDVSVIVKEKDGKMFSVIRLEVVDIYSYQIKYGSFNSLSSTIL